MKDHQLGYVPAALEGFEEQYVHPYPLGMPRRVIDEYNARGEALRKQAIAEVNRRMKLNELRVLWRSMTTGDSEGLIARGVVNPERAKQVSQGKPYDKRSLLSQGNPEQYVIRGQGEPVYATAKWQQLAQAAAKRNALAFNHGAQMQAQAQQNQAVQAVQNEYTDGLIAQVKASFTRSTS